MILVWASPLAPRAASFGGRVQLSWLERQQAAACGNCIMRRQARE